MASIPLLMRRLLPLLAAVLVGCAGGNRLPDPGSAANIPSAAKGDNHLLFAYFKRDVPGAMFIATSRNGYAWVPINGGEPVRTFKGTFRDPAISRGPDGRYHMVWTTVSPGRIGYSNSADLVEWSEQRTLPVMIDQTECLNCWAPELNWDAERSGWMIHWSSTVKGRFPETASDGDGNNRIYMCRTRDFKTLEPPRILFDPGFNVIDSSIFQADNRFHLFFKDERLKPKPRKRIHVARSDRLDGPYGEVSGPLSVKWVEAPSAIRLVDRYLVYHDFYVYWHNGYGAMTSTDLVDWTDITPRISMPAGARHGCVLRVEPDAFRRLITLQ